MAYKIPTANCWCRVWRNVDINEYVLAGYAYVQMRGPDSHADPVLGIQCVQVIFPKGSDVRWSDGVLTTVPDHIELAGQRGYWIRVEWVNDKGAGFSNEYRIALGSYARAPGFGVGNPLPPVNPELLPGDDYVPLPILDPWPDWEDPPP